MTGMIGGTSSAYLWRRYGARILDAYILGQTLLLIALLLLLLSSSDEILLFLEDERRWKRMLLYTPLMWIAAMPANAALTCWLGATPGKLIFGLRVVRSDGARPGFRRLLRREAELLLWGVGLGLPLVGLIMMIRSYAAVRDGDLARWDRHNETLVDARPSHGLQRVAIMVGAVVVMLLLGWGLVSRLSATLAI